MEFLKEQKPIQRSIGVNEHVIAGSKDGSFDNFLETGGDVSTMDMPSVGGNNGQYEKLLKAKT